MMEARNRKPGSVRLNERQYAEMERLGFDSESAYVKHLLEEGQTKLKSLKNPDIDTGVKMLPMVRQKTSNDPGIEDQLTIQRLSMENRKLQEKLEELSTNNQETLNGVHHKVHSMLQEELQKRDFETLKQDHAKLGNAKKELEKSLEDAKKETGAKQEEIEALVKKLGFVELGKALLPGAISGLAKQYPKQMHGIAGTLGRLGMTDDRENNDGPLSENSGFLEVIQYLRELCSEEQVEQVMELMVQLGQQMGDDTKLIQKIRYYLDQLQRKTGATKHPEKTTGTGTINNDQI